MDVFDGIIVGAATAAIGTIIAYKFLNSEPVGGDTPSQPMIARDPNFQQPTHLVVYDLVPTPDGASPVVQVNPITEAAYNQHHVEYENAFGSAVNQPAEDSDVLMPM